MTKRADVSDGFPLTEATGDENSRSLGVARRKELHLTIAEKEKQTMAAGLQAMNDEIQVEVENAVGGGREERGTTGTSDRMFFVEGVGQTNDDGSVGRVESRQESERVGVGGRAARRVRKMDCVDCGPWTMGTWTQTGGSVMSAGAKETGGDARQAGRGE